MKSPGRWMAEGIDSEGRTRVWFYAAVYNVCFAVMAFGILMMLLGTVGMVTGAW